jgi:hypothetical protein
VASISTTHAGARARTSAKNARTLRPTGTDAAQAASASTRALTLWTDGGAIMTLDEAGTLVEGVFAAQPICDAGVGRLAVG